MTACLILMFILGLTVIVIKWYPGIDLLTYIIIIVVFIIGKNTRLKVRFLCPVYDETF